MLALIRGAPVLAFLIATFASLSGGWLWNELVDNPHVRELVRVEERAACTIRTEAAADAAEQTERARQQAAGMKALREYRARVEARDQVQEKIQANLEREIAENESRLAAAGRSCLADQSDVDRWVRAQSR